MTPSYLTLLTPITYPPYSPDRSVYLLSDLFHIQLLENEPIQTTLLLVGTSQNLKMIASFHLNFAGHKLTSSPLVKMLGVTIDRSLS